MVREYPNMAGNARLTSFITKRVHGTQRTDKEKGEQQEIREETGQQKETVSGELYMGAGIGK
jgi:hypothetical protein